MTRPCKRIAVGLLAVVLAGVVSGTNFVPSSAPLEWSAAGPTLSPSFHQAVEEAGRKGEEQVELDLIVSDPGEMRRVREKVQESGGQMLLEEKAYAQVKIPLSAVAAMPAAVRAVSVGANQPVKADPSSLLPSNAPLTAAAASESIRLNLDASGIVQFRELHRVTGAGAIIAVIDSGIDPGHADLRSGPDGQPKLLDWKDFTTEGQVKTPYTVDLRETQATVNGRTYRLPTVEAASPNARFGFWDESKIQGVINRDLDRNGLRIDTFGVLLIDSSQTGIYDLIYVDTNNDNDFLDERPLRIFRLSQTVGRLGRFRTGEAAEEQLAFVVADVDQAGGWVQFGFDGHGHGTQVAGVLAAYRENGLKGAAPGAQLMALKVINSKNEGDWFRVHEAIRYAAVQGADVINVSLGGLGIASAYDSTAAERLNQIARDYGVLIVLASDNTGPGLSSGTTIGNPHEMLAVGAYYSPAMWKRDYGYVVPREGLWWRTGMGPRSDGSSVPSLVAPGGAPTTSPRWVDSTGYVTAVGTSIAAPHVSGAAALMMEAGRKSGLLHDRVSIKRALEFGARELSGLQVFEQGHGLLTLEDSFRHLQQMNTVPALSGQTLEGKGGLLARSYRPGGTSFVIANPSTTLTRVNVFSSEPWVRPALRSLTMPPGQARQLPLWFDPPSTPGVHSAFLLLNHQDRYGPSLTIPITFVQPVRLTQANQAFSTSEQLEVARYKRHFVDVTPGTNRLQVSTRVQVSPQGGAEGTVQVQVFRPDGVLAFRSLDFGARGNGLSSLFTAEQPVDGVWEIVVTALPDTDGQDLTAGYTLEVQSAPSLIDLPIRLNVTAGSTSSHMIRVANPNAPMVARVEAYGLRLQDENLPWRVVRELYEIDSFTLDTTAQILRVEIDGAIPASADLGLVLYRRGETKPVWVSNTPGSSREKIELTNLAAGQYQVFVTNNGSPPPGLQYQYRRSVANQAYNLSSYDETRRRERGQTWTVPLTVYAPSSPGRYKGQILLFDAERGETVAWYPIEVSVSQPSLTVQPLVSQLKAGESGSVVLEIRDSTTGSLVDGTVTVDGQRYLTRNGRVTHSVQPAGDVYSLQVEADLPAYQFLRQEIRLPVRKTWGTHPTGVETSPENSLWRRKLESLLP